MAEWPMPSHDMKEACMGSLIFASNSSGSLPSLLTASNFLCPFSSSEQLWTLDSSRVLGAIAGLWQANHLMWPGPGSEDLKGLWDKNMCKTHVCTSFGLNTCKPLVSNSIFIISRMMCVATLQNIKKKALKWHFLVMFPVREKYVKSTGFHTGKYGLLRESTALCTGVRFRTYLVRT